MAGLKDVEALMREGRFSDALHSLAKAKPSARREERFGVDVLEAHLLERTGNQRQSRTLCERLLRSQGLTNVQKSTCEATLGIIANDRAEVESAIAHFQRAVSLAQSGKDLQQTCWSQLRLMLALADRNGPHGAIAVFADVRANVVKLGDPQISAALHLFLGEMEARRGLIHNASRHTKLGLRLLGDSSNLWLEARAENTLAALAIMRSDILEGIEHAQRGLQFAELSGSASLKRACLGNLGNLNYLLGNFRSAIQFYERAEAELFVVGEMSSAALDSLARIRIREGNLDEAELCLERLGELVRTPADRLLHPNRHGELTRVELLDRQDAIPEALAASDGLLDVASRAGDHLLTTLVQLIRADLLQKTRQSEESGSILASLGVELPQYQPDVQALYERVLACALAADGKESSGRLHLERARRIYQGLQNAPGLLDLNRAWSETTGQPATPTHELSVSSPIIVSEGPRNPGNLLQNIATLMMHAGRPELIATGLVSILADSGSVTSAAAISRASDGTIDTLASFDASPTAAHTPKAPARTIAIGSARNRTIEVTLQPLGDIESTATLNAAALLLATVRDLERAHAEREERQTLWPVEEIPTEGDEAVVAGKMRELMSFARRVATTTVSVLITGGSDPQPARLDRVCWSGTAAPLVPRRDRTAPALPRASAA